jgi:hypothetical protein
MVSEASPERERSEARDKYSGAAPESNRPSRGLHDRTSFEDQLGHRAHAAPAVIIPELRWLVVVKSSA